MDILLAKRRAVRMREWKSIRCYFVLPFSAVAPDSKTYKPFSWFFFFTLICVCFSYATLAGLHYRLHELYHTSQRCKSGSCNEASEFLVGVMKHQIKRLTRYLRQKDFVSRIRRQRSRARQNRQFSQLYRRALGCKSIECRRDTRDALVTLQTDLDEEERTFDIPKIDHHVSE
jgi:hypothetical protein